MPHVTIKITEGKHTSQPWTYTIDKPGGGPLETKRVRYGRKSDCKRGALRELEARKEGDLWYCTIKGKRCRVQFHWKYTPKKRAS